VKKLVVEMKIIADGVIHHVAKTFLHLQVFLPAIVAKLTLQNGSAIKAIVFFPIMFLHMLNSRKLCHEFIKIKNIFRNI